MQEKKEKKKLKNSSDLRGSEKKQPTLLRLNSDMLKIV